MDKEKIDLDMDLLEEEREAKAGAFDAEDTFQNNFG